MKKPAANGRKPPAPRSNRDAELRELRARLQEAEDTLLAIRQGDVDALVVSAGGQEQVYTLKGADEPYRVILETMSEGAATIDQDGTIQYCNQQLATMLGLPLERTIGSSLRHAVRGSERTRFITFLEHTTNQPGRLEFTLRRPDRSKLPVQISVSSLPLDGNQNFIAIVTDLSERKRAEEAVRSLNADLENRVSERTADLLEANRRLRLEEEELASVALFPAENPDPVLRIGRDGKLLYHNLASTGLLAALGWHPGDPPPAILQDAAFSVLTEGRQQESEVSLPDGRCFLAAGAPFIERGYANLYLRDITRRRQAEEARRESEERFRALFSEMHSGAALHEIICDDSGQPVDYRFLDLNPAFEILTGLTCEQTVGHTARELIPGLDRHRIEMYGRVALTGEPIHFEMYAEELKRHLDCNVYCPAPRQFAVIFNDVTERKRVEQDLRLSRDRFELLADTAGQLLRSREPQHIVHALCYDVMKSLDCHVFFNYLLDESSGRLRLNSYDGIDEADAANIQWLDRGQAICGLAAKHKRRVVAEHIQLAKDPAAAVVRSYGVKAYCAHPLLGPDGQVLGTLSFGSRDQETLSEQHLTLMKAVADQVAVALVRQKAEEALHVSEERLTTGLWATQVGLWDWDLKAARAHYSPTWYTMLGYEPYELPESVDTWSALMHPDDVPETNRAVERALTGEMEAFETETRLKTKNGEWKWVLSRARVTERDAEHRPLRMIGTHTDITERKRVEDALRQSERELRIAQRVGQIGNWSWDPGIDEGAWSEELFRIYGHDPVESTTRELADEVRRSYVGDSLDRLKSAVDRAVQDGSPWNLELEMRTPDGRHKWLDSRGEAERDSSGRICRLHGTVQDITERIRVEEQIRESRADLDRAQAVAHIGGWRIGRESEDLVWSDETYRLLGVPLGTPVNYRQFLTIIHPDDREYVNSQWMAAQQAGVFDIEYRVVVDGQVKWVHAICRPDEFKPEESDSFFGTIQDITERKQAEQALAEHTKGQEFLSASATRLLEPMSAAELLQHTAQRVRDLTGEAVVVVSEFDAVARQTILRAFAGPESKLQAAYRLMGDPLGLRLDFREETIRKMRSGTLVEVEGRLYELSFGQIPEPLCRQLEREADLGAMYAMPFQLGEDFMGIVAVMADRKEGLRNRRLVESVVNQSALALQRRRMEEALQLSDDRFRLALSSSPITMSIMDREYRNVWVYNPPPGFELEAVLGRPQYELYPPEMAEILVAPRRQVFETGQRVYTQIALPEGNGSLRYWEMTLEPMRNSSGDIVAAISVSVEITERKRIEEALRASEEGLRTAQRVAQIGNWSWDPKTDAGYWSDELFRIYGRDPALGTPSYHAEDVRRSYVGDSLQRLDSAVERALRDGPPWALELEMQMPDGSHKWLDARGEIERDANGAVHRLHGTVQDITKLKLVMDALRESETRARAQAQQLQAIMEAVPVGVFLAHDSACSRITGNPGAYQLLSMPIGSNVSQTAPHPITHWKEMKDGRVLAPNELPLQRAGRGEEVRFFEMDIVFDEGTTKTVLCNASPTYGHEGKLSGAVAVLADITERKQLEEQIRRHNEELEQIVIERTHRIQLLERQRVEAEKQVALGRMAARIAHEINNPLAAVKNAFRIVKKTIPGASPDYEFVELIDSEMSRIERIVRQTYELYRPERREPVTLSPVDTVTDVVHLMQGSIQASGINVVVSPPEQPFQALVHADSLKQLLYGILQNAIEASPPKTTVRISMARQESSFTLAVADQGCGISEEIGQKIFEPFFTTKSGLETGGLGLGLSITRTLLEAMGGAISYESRPGKGATFFVTLPLVAPETVPSGKPQPAAVSLHKV